jgi:hypothetical protein
MKPGVHGPTAPATPHLPTGLTGHGLAPQDDEVVRAQHQEARELSRQDLVHLVELLHLGRGGGGKEAL